MTTFSHDHVGLSVGDLDAQRRFYIEALGVQEHSYVEIPQTQTRIAFLAASELRIELVEHGGSMPHRAADPLQEAQLQTWFHWALAVADLEDAITAAIAAGAEQVTAPSHGQRPGIRFAYLRDPEGNLIELLEADLSSGTTSIR